MSIQARQLTPPVIFQKGTSKIQLDITRARNNIATKDFYPDDEEYGISWRKGVWSSTGEEK